MSNKRLRKKQRPALNRAMPAYPPGGSLMYVPVGQQQGVLGQTFYGSKAGIPTGQTALFTPGEPLPAQPGVNPNGLPVQFKFPISYNTYPVDRTLGNPDIPSFEQLKRLAIMDYGIALCERYWLDMVPRMTLKISLSPEAIAGGAEEKNYQKQITYFKNFFDRPDAQMDMHSWLRAALINQSRYDELYIYKNRTRGGKLLGLEIVDGAQMKPLLDDWGRLPQPPGMAYQQYPWGIPGWMYSQDQMIHYRETPASDTPYGFSRIERIILITNLALRKQKADLAHFTDGNVPAGLLMPPESSNWTPDQLDSYEQSWNALMAGNLQQLARIKVVQPGFQYTPFVQPNFDSVFDRFMLNIRTAAYGMTMADLGFTETVNKSSGDTQENVTYRRTIGPIASIYASILTDTMHSDFDPSLQGEMFVVSFGGYEEAEDLASTATAYTTLVQSGILGVSNAGKLMKLPEDPDAPHIGRILITKDGPIFLDDMATDKMRDAAANAKMAGFQLAANPPQVAANPEDVANEEDTQGQDEKDVQPQAKPGTKGTAKGSSNHPQAAQNNDGGSDQTRSIESDDRFSRLEIEGSREATKRIASAQELAGNETRSKAGRSGDQSRHSLELTTQANVSERTTRSGGEGSIRSDAMENDNDLTVAHHTGMMLAFQIDPGVAQQLALPGGETWEDMHITLAYLGDVADPVQPGKLQLAKTPDVMKAVLSAFTSNTQPLQGSVGGLARFTPSDSSNEMSPVIALVNAPGLQEWRRRLVNAIDAAGYSIANDFDYTPHITLAYIDNDASMPVKTLEPLPLLLDTLILAIGDEVTTFSIGADNEQRTPQNTETETRVAGDSGRRTSETATKATLASTAQPGNERNNPKEASADFRRWRTRALEDVKQGRIPRHFDSTVIPLDLHQAMDHALIRCKTPDEVRTVFKRVQEGDPDFFA